MLNGYDIDGVLSAGVIPEEPYVVVSGRGAGTEEDDDYVALLRKSARVFLRPESFPNTNQGVGEWKSLVINILNITRFFEDQPWQIHVIKEMTHGCEVIAVGSAIE
jgi:hypothetical protein